MKLFYAKIAGSIFYFPSHIVNTIWEEDYRFPKDVAHADSQDTSESPKKK
jgi:hypothetical protein